jgi:AraC-like DNA-binding protein
MKQPSVDKILFYDFKRTLGVEVVHGTDVKHAFSRHTHRTLCIGAVEQGVRVLLCRRERFEVNPGQVFFIPPGEAHACGSGGALHTYLIFLISPAILDMILPKTVEDSHIFKQLVFSDKTRFEQMLNLYSVLIGEEADFFKQSVLISTIGDIVECSAQISSYLKISNKQYESIKHVRDFIESNYEERFSLGNIASKAQLSPYYLIRLFSQIVGIPPHIYQQQVRIRHAKEMLMQGIPIVDVAFNTGFADQSHFSNVFKKMVGLPPGEYSKSCLLK